MPRKVIVAENLEKPIVQVRHADLKRMNDTSPFRSWCPTCDQGVMLVQRDGVKLLRIDHCTMCGQRFVYTDDEIDGVPLHPPLPELLEKLQHHIKVEPRTRFDRIDES